MQKIRRFQYRDVSRRTRLREQSLFGFVNDDPSPIDDIRHAIPLLIRVGDQVYPSLALQTLCQMLGVDPDKVEVDRRPASWCSKIRLGKNMDDSDR